MASRPLYPTVMRSGVGISGGLGERVILVFTLRKECNYSMCAHCSVTRTRLYVDVGLVGEHTEPK